MKKRVVSLFLLLFLGFSLIGCGDSGVFTHCELSIPLDESFREKESDSFDLLISDGQVAVGVTRLSFIAALNQGISDTYTAKGFAAFFMHESGKSDKLDVYEDVPYYTYTEQGENTEMFYTAAFYRSMNAYFIVIFGCPADLSDERAEDMLKYAAGAYFNDAPVINEN